MATLSNTNYCWKRFSNLLVQKKLRKKINVKSLCRKQVLKICSGFLLNTICVKTRLTSQSNKSLSNVLIDFRSTILRLIVQIFVKKKKKLILTKKAIYICVIRPFLTRSAMNRFLLTTFSYSNTSSCQVVSNMYIPGKKRNNIRKMSV